MSNVVDITIVVYGEGAFSVGLVFNALAKCIHEFRTLRLLVSGSNLERETVTGSAISAGIQDRLEIIHRFDNLGFASGHNLLLERSFHTGADYVLLLNPDVYVAEGAITNLLAVVRERRLSAHLVGPALRRRDDVGSADDACDRSATPMVDSLGIGWTHDARHFDLQQGERWPPMNRQVDDVWGVSGACLLVSDLVFNRVKEGSGYFLDPSYLAYREDAELGVRARYLGCRAAIVRLDGFEHVRAVRGFTRNSRLPDLLGVRNRFLLRWGLGELRPGNRLASLFRDLLVAGAALTIERRSATGLVSAFRIRRFLTNSSWHAWRLFVRSPPDD